MATRVTQLLNGEETTKPSSRHTSTRKLPTSHRDAMRTLPDWALSGEDMREYGVLLDAMERSGIHPIEAAAMVADSKVTP